MIYSFQYFTWAIFPMMCSWRCWAASWKKRWGRLRVMKQSSDFIWSPFSKSLKKVETVTGRGIFYAESSQGATRRVELNQPWRCITLGWKVNRPTQNTSTKLETEIFQSWTEKYDLFIQMTWLSLLALSMGIWNCLVSKITIHRWIDQVFQDIDTRTHIFE